MISIINGKLLKKDQYAYLCSFLEWGKKFNVVDKKKKKILVRKLILMMFMMLFLQIQ